MQSFHCALQSIGCMSHRSPQSARVRQIVLNPEHVEPLESARFFAAAAGNARHPASITGITSVVIRMTILPGFEHPQSARNISFCDYPRPVRGLAPLHAAPGELMGGRTHEIAAGENCLSSIRDNAGQLSIQFTSGPGPQRLRKPRQAANRSP